MRTACIQFDIINGDVKKNLEKAASLIEKAVRQKNKPDVIVLPELWSTGYALNNAKVLATENGEREANFLTELAGKYDVSFAGGSVLAREGNCFYNRAQIIDKNCREIAHYNKIHLFSPMEEDKYLTAGNKICRFDLCNIPCASIICYDLRFCELPRKQALDNAKVLFISAEWPAPRTSHWKILLQARAIENQMHVIACNRTGYDGNTVFEGNSMIIACDGTILAEAGKDEGIIQAELPEKILPFDIFKDRRADIY